MRGSGKPRFPLPTAENPTDEVFCQSCGQIIKKEAVICIKCGVPVKRGGFLGPAIPKDKTAAVLLAVFLGIWTWVYTYKRDAWKFWLNLGLMIPLTLLTLGFWVIVPWIWAIIDVAVKPSEWYQNFPNG